MVATLDPEHMREQARRCFRLARAISNSDVIDALEALGREFEAKAAELEGAARQDQNVED